MSSSIALLRTRFLRATQHPIGSGGQWIVQRTRTKRLPSLVQIRRPKHRKTHANRPSRLEVNARPTARMTPLSTGSISGASVFGSSVEWGDRATIRGGAIATLNLHRKLLDQSGKHADRVALPDRLAVREPLSGLFDLRHLAG